MGITRDNKDGSDEDESGSTSSPASSSESDGDDSSASSESTSDDESTADSGTTESGSTATSSAGSSSSSTSLESGTRSARLRRKQIKKRGRKGISKPNENAKPKRRRRRKRQMAICLSNCRYEVVRSVARSYGLQEVGEDEAWNVYWTDYSVSLERAMDMKRYQLVNHFPGMNEICRKDLLSRNLNRMKRLFSSEYDIFPRTWSLPADLGELQQYAQGRRNKTYICKPEMGCQGRGIFLIRNIKELNPFGKIICQLYIARPFLIDNLKFDLRIYVLITTCDPLRIYVYNEGLARFATSKYKAPTNNNTENAYMHLTNYAVNKFSQNFIVDDEGGSKRKLSAVYRWLEERGYDIKPVMANIDDVIIKTIVSAHPILKHNYRTCFPQHDLCSACFEILGFDILLDHKLKPYVLEVNHSPSFHTDSQLDRDIKETLLRDTFAMLHLKQLDVNKVERDDRRRVQSRLTSKRTERKPKPENDVEAQELQLHYELKNAGNYRLVYPVMDQTEKYDKFFEHNWSSLYQGTAASQARATCTKNQIEEYNKLKQAEEKKRVQNQNNKAAAATAGTTSAEKTESPASEKVRPESPSDVDKTKKKKIVTAPTPLPQGQGFLPSSVVAEEELDRMKQLMQRGMLVRSLGVELHAFKLLSQLGSLKPEEERLFRRLHPEVGATVNTGEKPSQQVLSKALRPISTAIQDAPIDRVRLSQDPTRTTEERKSFASKTDFSFSSTASIPLQRKWQTLVPSGSLERGYPEGPSRLVLQSSSRNLGDSLRGRNRIVAPPSFMQIQQRAEGPKMQQIPGYHNNSQQHFLPDDRISATRRVAAEPLISFANSDDGPKYSNVKAHKNSADWFFRGGIEMDKNMNEIPTNRPRTGNTAPNNIQCTQMFYDESQHEFGLSRSQNRRDPKFANQKPSLSTSNGHKIPPVWKDLNDKFSYVQSNPAPYRMNMARAGEKSNLVITGVSIGKDA